MECSLCTSIGIQQDAGERSAFLEHGSRQYQQVFQHLLNATRTEPKDKSPSSWMALFGLLGSTKEPRHHGWTDLSPSYGCLFFPMLVLGVQEVVHVLPGSA